MQNICLGSISSSTLTFNAKSAHPRSSFLLQNNKQLVMSNVSIELKEIYRNNFETTTITTTNDFKASDAKKKHHQKYKNHQKKNQHLRSVDATESAGKKTDSLRMVGLVFNGIFNSSKMATNKSTNKQQYLLTFSGFFHI